MALTKEITINKIESVGPQRTIQIQYKTSVKEDGK